MIRIRFRELVDDNRFTIQQIHKETGINRNTLTDLYYDRLTRIDLDTLNRLYVFFNKYIKSDIVDLIEYIKE